MSQNQQTIISVASIAAALCLLTACLSMGTPNAGKPVTINPSEALVFGRILMQNEKNEQIKYSPFWFDPWDQPFFGPGPRMTLELRQLYPPGGIFKYKTHPSPSIERNGSFFWILSSGDYVLLGNPRLYGSKRFSHEETVKLAHFSVPASGGTIYIGTLIINIVFDTTDVISAWRTGEAAFVIRSCHVVDDRDRELSRLHERFPSVPVPMITEHMHAD